MKAISHQHPYNITLHSLHLQAATAAKQPTQPTCTYYHIRVIRAHSKHHQQFSKEPANSRRLYTNSFAFLSHHLAKTKIANVFRGLDPAE